MVSKKRGQITHGMGNRLRQIRERKGMTRDSVAESAGISVRHLAAVELEQKSASVDTLYHLISVGFLLSLRLFRRLLRVLEDAAGLGQKVRLPVANHVRVQSVAACNLPQRLLLPQYFQDHLRLVLRRVALVSHGMGLLSPHFSVLFHHTMFTLFFRSLVRNLGAIIVTFKQAGF